jgi:hypothetical protein
MGIKTINYLMIGFFLLINFNAIANDDVHKFYVSHLNMKYNEQSKTFQLSFSIFTEDLEMTLGNQSNEKINLDVFTDANEKLVFDYVKQHFSTKIEGESLKLKSIGYELDVDIAWVYIETIQTEIPNSIEITNTILFELFPDQKNMVKINIGEEDYSALLTIKNPIEILKLNENE